jgi:ABC-type Zn uptake system ZnuABC Zn-binding protein ZnuA
VRRVLLLTALGAGLAFAACGQSDEEKAKADVCDARDDIEANVKELRSLTLGTVTADKVRTSLEAIRDDVKKIADAQGDLSESDKEQIRKANEAFKSKVQALAGDLGKSVSIEAAVKQLKADFADLAATYEQSFAPIDCG